MAHRNIYDDKFIKGCFISNSKLVCLAVSKTGFVIGTTTSWICRMDISESWSRSYESEKLDFGYVKTENLDWKKSLRKRSDIMPSTEKHYPEEWTDKNGNKRLTCICGNELPCMVDAQNTMNIIEKFPIKIVRSNYIYDFYIKRIMHNKKLTWTCGYYRKESHFQQYGTTLIEAAAKLNNFLVDEKIICGEIWEINK